MKGKLHSKDQRQINAMPDYDEEDRKEHMAKTGKPIHLNEKHLLEPGQLGVVNTANDILHKAEQLRH